MKRFKVEFVLETEDDEYETTIMQELNYRLDLWVEADDSNVLRAYGRDVEEVSD